MRARVGGGRSLGKVGKIDLIMTAWPPSGLMDLLLRRLRLYRHGNGISAGGQSFDRWRSPASNRLIGAPARYPRWIPSVLSLLLHQRQRNRAIRVEACWKPSLSCHNR